MLVFLIKKIRIVIWCFIFAFFSLVLLNLFSLPEKDHKKEKEEGLENAEPRKSSSSGNKHLNSAQHVTRATGDETTLGITQVEGVLQTGASQLTRTEVEKFWVQLTSPENVAEVAPLLLKSKNMWNQLIGWMALIESGSASIDWDTFPFDLNSINEQDELNSLLAVSLMADWLFQNEYFDEWKKFLLEMSDLTIESSREILFQWRSNREDVPAIFYFLGTDSMATHRLIPMIAGRSSEMVDAMIEELESGALSKHWTIEYWSVLYNSGFPDGISVYESIVEITPQTPQRDYAIQLLREYETASDVWDEISTETSTSIESAFISLSWLYQHKSVQPSSEQLLQIKKLLEDYPKDDALNRKITYLNYLIFGTESKS